MGYCADVTGSDFRVKEENLAPALVALKRWVDKEKYIRWARREVLSNAPTLQDFMLELGWDFETGKEGDVIGISFQDNKLGSEDNFFAALAPFVEDGSFIEMVGEDHAAWRWYFHDKKLFIQDPEITWHIRMPK